MAEQSPEQAIEQGKALAVPMQDRDLRELDEFCGNVEGAVLRLQQCLGASAANNPGSAPRTDQITSAGLTPFCANARAALRQPSKSVSPSRMM